VGRSPNPTFGIADSDHRLSVGRRPIISIWANAPIVYFSWAVAPTVCGDLSGPLPEWLSILCRYGVSQAPVCLWAVGQEEVYLWVVRYPRSRLWQSVWAVTQVAVYLVPVRSFQVAVCLWAVVQEAVHLWAVGQEEVHLWVVRYPRSCHSLGVVPSSSLWALAPPSIFFRGH
jgi:hypothetical protein